MNSPFRWGWLTNRRVIQFGSYLVVLAVLGVVLYNATAVDRVPPGVVYIKLDKVVPSTSLALTRTDVDVQFSEDVVQSTAEAAFKLTGPNGSIVAGGITWTDAQTMVFTPSNKLPLNTVFLVTVGPGVKDKAGNPSTDTKTFKFTTVAEPVVSDVSPKSGSTNVPVDTTIVITFDRPMDTGSVNNAIQITPDVGSADMSWSQQVLTITPKTQLQFATEYTVKIAPTAVDGDGTPLAAYQATFTTIPKGLTVVSKIPAPGVAGVSPRTPIAVVFDGAIDPNSISSAFQITPPVDGSVHAIDLPNDSKPSSQAAAPNLHVLTFTPNQPLAPHTTYTVVLKPGIKRTNGEAADGATWSFTTGELLTTAQNQIMFLSDRAGVSNVWIMNPDGTNQRQVTTELVPVVSFDVTGDGSKILYSAGGLVKRMSVSGGDLTTMTTNGNYEYAPSFTPDSTAVVLGRRDATGNDKGYWKVSLGGGEQQIVNSGAPGIGSVTLTGDGLTGDPGRSSWAARTAYSSDGKSMLLVRGDLGVELVDLTGATQPAKLDLDGLGAPVYVKSTDAFYVVASSTDNATPGYWKVERDGTEQRLGDAVGDMAAASDGRLAILTQSSDGATHLQIVAPANGGASQSLPASPSPQWSERSPSFSPDGKTIVFSRVFTDQPTQSGGIWIVKTDGTGLSSLATDGTSPRWVP